MQIIGPCSPVGNRLTIQLHLCFCQGGLHSSLLAWLTRFWTPQFSIKKLSPNYIIRMNIHSFSSLVVFKIFPLVCPFKDRTLQIIYDSFWFQFLVDGFIRFIRQLLSKSTRSVTQGAVAYNCHRLTYWRTLEIKREESMMQGCDPFNPNVWNFVKVNRMWISNLELKDKNKKKYPLCFEPKFCRKFGLTILATKSSCTVEVVLQIEGSVRQAFYDN